MKIKIRFVFLGLKDVDWTKYDFHITPVLTYTKVIHPSQSIGKLLSVEWGHWGISFQYFKLNK